VNEPSANGGGPLKLVADEATDLTIIAACLQDALAPVSDIAWLTEENAFALAVNRFMWERRPENTAAGPLYHRTHALVRIAHVGAVRSRGFSRSERSRILSLLSLRPVDGGVDLVFSDGAAIRVLTDKLHVTLADMGAPWPTRFRPGHPED